MSLADVFSNWMSDGTIAWGGLALELVVGIGYVEAASRRSPRGRRWPVNRTASFLAGLLVIALALDSGIAAHDDVPSVHMLQHALLMMLGPMLLVLGAPVTLAMRTMPGVGRRRLLAVLRDPSVRQLIARPAVLIADYNVTMALLLLAPVYRLAERHIAIHIAAHAYLIACGLLFWTAMLARDPVPGRLPRRSRIASIALCVPLNLVLAGAVAFAPHAFVNAGHREATAVAAILTAATIATSLLGVGIIAGGRRVVTLRRPVRFLRPGRLRYG